MDLFDHLIKIENVDSLETDGLLNLQKDSSLNELFDNSSFQGHENTDLALNDIFVNSNQGLEWLSLTDDDLSNDVDELRLSAFNDDVQLMRPQVSSVNRSYPQSIMQMRDCNLEVIHETGESSSLDEDIEIETLTETAEDTTSYSEGKKHVLASRHARRTSFGSHNFKTLMPASSTVASTSESNNSDSSIQGTVSQKRKCGWQRKRKTEFYDMKPPKPPSTGYVFFLLENRPHYLQNKPFNEVTKLLGHEWTKMGRKQKKVYLDRAEADKKRYREELRAYRKTDAYQSYLRWKRAKRKQNNGTESDMTDEFTEEDNELYCEVCDQWFHNFQNKRAHLKGRIHLLKLSDHRARSSANTDNSSSFSNESQDDESSLDGMSAPSSPSISEVATSTSSTHPTTLIPSLHSPGITMEDNINAILGKFAEREAEIRYLKQRVEETRVKCRDMKVSIADLHIRKEELLNTMSKLDAEQLARDQLIQGYVNLIKVTRNSS